MYTPKNKYLFLVLIHVILYGILSEYSIFNETTTLLEKKHIIDGDSVQMLVCITRHTSRRKILQSYSKVLNTKSFFNR